ncbi:zwei Ig domain protein zig-8-like [Anopheles albimanus]|uniref:Ig-like domain-containing protein n=1 Tax=Anopheles albimanus TaxID=7167 RepID=A0A182F7S9_ANOAL|nr:zwei Ig domain protein zig-8-like [Anopheles albimanus]XP_035783884.1 zwei Ig domain protein zig-8-like [Anopheles albimanus]XP_035783885.1 zwei Ig domain protein zig-8-like [Anopheles albimanus]XP_035783886.1 zwei Ig domain protein zig-8-like [Anopheles albimanus]XP_035783887.1 zwei Ig domain protein zig-8-like [Anopheles albimanus]
MKSWVNGLAVLYLGVLHCVSGSVLKNVATLQSSSPFMTFPRNFWQEISVPYTDLPTDDDELEDESVESTTHDPYPFFDDINMTANVTTQLGSDVTLHCRVNDLRERTVSWVRRKGDEIHLITVGRQTYSSDSRYSLQYQPPNDWQLQIQYSNERDEGHYECQISSHPPLVYLVYLIVVVPRVEIIDERGQATLDKFYKAGSTIELKCIISRVPQPTSYVTWKHGMRMLNYDTSRGGISVKTDLLPGGAMSRLYIANANRHDTGNYTCALADIAQATVSVHVLNGENPAAMQHGAATQRAPASTGAMILFLLASLLLNASR